MSKYLKNHLICIHVLIFYIGYLQHYGVKIVLTCVENRE